ncbi:MAG: hydantoinase B/oxoprolinase family protein [Planctomycetota bacterium]|jgi:N-methylhydantoinase B
MNAADLAVFDALFSGIAEEMGEALVRAATSVNIKERRDLSCAIFDRRGRLVAQAAHIPVHLGAMPLSVRAALEAGPLEKGDVVLLNDPWAGGTHLPDLTAVTAAGDDFIVANRAHHADIGGAAPGSLGLARDIHGEGLRLPPVRLVKSGAIDEDLMRVFCANVRAPDERRQDLEAQVATLQRGVARLAEARARVGAEQLGAAADALRNAAKKAAIAVVRTIPPGQHSFADALDGSLNIRVTIAARSDRLVIDFDGTDPQVDQPLNANLAVTLSAATYALALLLPEETPLNEGVHGVIDLLAPEGSLVNAAYPAPVAGGNVETSQRIVDVVLGALDAALPGRMPAASQGTMNNLTLGGNGWTYYETTAGGAGGGPRRAGASAVQSHMTNTRNTPIEALENELPLRVERLEVRRGSGGAGAHPGGDGIRKIVRFTEPCQGHLLTDRRETAPYGLAGGAPGAPGTNTLHRTGGKPPERLPGRCGFVAGPGDRLEIETPGGGGWGAP